MNIPEQEMVSITKKEYEALKKKEEWLSYLEAAGIDNTDAYSYAQELRSEDEK